MATWPRRFPCRRESLVSWSGWGEGMDRERLTASWTLQTRRDVKGRLVHVRAHPQILS